MKNNQSDKSVVMLGATGAVGMEALKQLLKMNRLKKLVLLGRRPVKEVEAEFIQQHNINIFDPTSYQSFVNGVDIAICTLGVGEPSKISREEFVKIDKLAVLDFARVCKFAGVKHFELLSSVGISAESRNYYLRIKGELVKELEALNFERLSIFQPSLILTPKNRYGFLQGVMLLTWPIFSFFLVGGLRKYRGIKVSELGASIAKNIYTKGKGMETLQYDDFKELL